MQIKVSANMNSCKRSRIEKCYSKFNEYDNLSNHKI